MTWKTYTKGNPTFSGDSGTARFYRYVYKRGTRGASLSFPALDGEPYVAVEYLIDENSKRLGVRFYTELPTKAEGRLYTITRQGKVLQASCSKLVNDLPFLISNIGQEGYAEVEFTWDAENQIAVIQGF